MNHSSMKNFSNNPSQTLTHRLILYFSLFLLRNANLKIICKDYTMFCNSFNFTSNLFAPGTPKKNVTQFQYSF